MNKTEYKYGFMVVEDDEQIAASKFTNDSHIAVMLVLNKDYLRKLKHPLKLIRRLELLFKDALKQVIEQRDADEKNRV